MKAINAFVGHSFAHEDADVIRKFLKMLTRLSDLRPEFTWDHAEDPEPKQIVNKVLEKLDGKNLFIGICTKKERVVADNKLARTWFSSRKLIGAADAFQWKASDWVLQEIGLAVGRGMDVLLLLEDGIRVPGELQGNPEHVVFSRDAPEQCFDSLAGMIASYVPSARLTVSSNAEGRVAKEKEANKYADATDKWSEPQPGWRIDDYEIGMHYAIHHGNIDAEKKINDHFLRSPIASNDALRGAWSALIVSLKIKNSADSTIADLQKLADESPTNCDIWCYLGSTYSDYGEFKQAAAAFEKAANNSEDMPRRIRLLGSAMCAAAKAGDDDFTLRIAGTIRDLNTAALSSELAALDAIREHAIQQNAFQLILGTLERSLELDPSDDEKRFALAYKYSELDMDTLAALHYSRIPARKRTAAAWNNLGVAYQTLGLPAQAISAYQQSRSHGETLAMSNLANALIDSGFLPEADAILDSAIRTNGHHKNVDTSLARMKGVPDAEGKKEIAAYGAVKSISEFYRYFGRAAVRALAIDITGPWQSAKGLLELSRQHLDVVIAGNYEIRIGALIMALRGKSSSDGSVDSTAIEKVAMLYRGRLIGCAILGTVQRRSSDEKLNSGKSLLAQGDDHPIVLMWLSDDGQRIHVLEQSTKDSPQIYTLIRKPVQ